MGDLMPERQARSELVGRIAEMAVDAIQRAGFVILRADDADRVDAETHRLRDENAILRAEVEYLTGRLAALERPR